MQRKPDLLWILALILGLGIVTTGYTQSQWQPEQAETTAPVISLQAQ
ncbi:hypothetical protein SAMN05216214_103163 [Atopomonas hussainii]|uniref:Uncharacterized protein n=1 Tax=Atopomonas hussainii TaxID=1429083 RepID=A0A1H7I1T9_9GAMM|nr:hypothetical protein [Atopomonas hussainii]SEK56334.1 hypothetical protein SAMN05216214_103163 [Atopomonas hussainii]